MTLIESEKVLEKKLGVHVKNLGGLSVKLLSNHFTGLPDRLVLLPKGRILFVEVKTTKQKPRKRQLYVHGLLRDLGFKVIVLDKSEQLKLIK